MIIKRSIDDSGFILTLENEIGLTHVAFTAIETNRHMRHYARVMYRGDHKVSIHVTEQQKFWQLVEDAGVPVTYVSSSNATEGNFTGAAA